MAPAFAVRSPPPSPPPPPPPRFVANSSCTIGRIPLRNPRLNETSSARARDLALKFDTVRDVGRVYMCAAQYNSWLRAQSCFLQAATRAASAIVGAFT